MEEILGGLVALVYTLFSAVIRVIIWLVVSPVRWLLGERLFFWVAAVFSALLVSLACSFAWYEFAKPPWPSCTDPNLESDLADYLEERTSRVGNFLGDVRIRDAQTLSRDDMNATCQLMYAGHLWEYHIRSWDRAWGLWSGGYASFRLNGVSKIETDLQNK